MTDPSRSRNRASFTLGDWIVHPPLNRLERDGQTVQTEPRPMQVLVCLAVAKGDVVSRDALLDDAWGDVVVGEEALTRAISELRRILGDSSSAPRYIETIRKGGYRLVASVGAVDVPTEIPDEEHPPKETLAPPEGRTSSQQPASPPVGTERSPWWIPGLGLAVVAAIIGGWFLLDRSDAPTPEIRVPLPSIPLTSFVGNEEWPALSPDGSKIAFTWGGTEGDNLDIYVKQVGEESPLRLTDHPSWDSYPVWMSDGETLGFIHGDETGVGIYVTTLLGDEPRRILESPHLIKGFCWLEDGTKLIYSGVVDDVCHLRIRDLGTGEDRPLTTPPANAEDVEPRLSPDGESVAFVRSDSSQRDKVLVVPISGGKPIRLPAGQASLRGIQWDRDGSSIVFSSNLNGNYSLWRTYLDGARTEWIPIHGEWMFTPTIAAQSDRLVYQHRWFEKNIWRVRRGTNELSTSPLVTSSRWDCEARYSADGTQLAFVSTRSGSLEIWSCRSDGTRPLQLSQFKGPSVGSPRWSPDGSQISFTAGPDGFSDLFLLDPVSRETRRLTASPSNDLYPDWSADGEWLAFASDRSGAWEIWRRPAEEMADPAAVQLTHSGAAYGRISADGAFLYFARMDEPGLWRLNLATEREERVITDLPRLGGWSNWDLWSDGVVMVDQDVTGPGSGTFLVEHIFSTGVTTTIAKVPNVAAPSVTVSPDGAEVLYARIEKNVGDLVLVEGFR